MPLMRPSTHDQFVARYGGVYEASPWVAEAVFDDWYARKLNTVERMAAAMRAVVDAAPADRKLALIRAHPELASRTRMAEASVREQSGAGLDQCSPEEFDAFRRLNAAYDARFGHPFIVAVKGMSRAEILSAFEARLLNAPDVEAAAAIAEIHRIARFRLEDLMGEGA
jgi:2-oxo-4-hydroxy-4-carboxy-5-ureidoimidazoline decarboxylase